jgi:transposase
VITDPIVIAQRYSRLPDVTVLGIDDDPGVVFRAHVECVARVHGCPTCGVVAHVKDRYQVELIDLPIHGDPARLVWHKRRLRCPDPDCPMGSWVERDARIASSKLSMTDRAGRWITKQVGKFARSVNEVAEELGCDWHTVNDALLAYGTALVEDDPERYGLVRAFGLDEVLFVREGGYRRQHFSTSIVDVDNGQLLDVVPDRGALEPTAWLERRGTAFLAHVAYATLDLSGPYRSVFDHALPYATQVADPFHLVKLANQKLDECRRRVQNEVFGHRGRKNDPLYRARRLLTKANERLNDQGREKLLGLLAAGDPKGHVMTAWHAKEVVRSVYDLDNEMIALEFVERLGLDLQDQSCPLEVRSLGRTLLRWNHQIVAWHEAHFTNAPTEAANNLIKRVKRAASGFRSFRNYRIRALLYTGKPNWDLLATNTPR